MLCAATNNENLMGGFATSEQMAARFHIRIEHANTTERESPTYSTVMTLANGILHDFNRLCVTSCRNQLWKHQRTRGFRKFD